MARWSKQVDLRSVINQIKVLDISLTEGYKRIYDTLGTITYTEADSPHHEHLNEILSDIRDWFMDMVEYNSNDVDEFEIVLAELISFGDQIIKDSFLKCRKVKALCVLR